MHLKSIIHNIATKGLSETVVASRIKNGSPLIESEIKKAFRKAKKEDRETLKLMAAYHARCAAAFEMSALFEKMGDAESSSRAKELAEKALTLDPANDPESFEDINTGIKKLETDEYRKYAKAVFLKELVPEAYNGAKGAPVEDKILFLQPRRKLNPSCKLIYNRLKRMGKDEVKLFELNRFIVSMTEEYINLLGFIKEMATAKAVLTHEFSEYFGYIDIREETKMIQLWHGCGIIKGIGMDTSDVPGAEFKTKKDYEEYPEFDQYDLVTIPSEAERPIFESLMGKKDGAPEVKAIGVSRSDEFFDEVYLTSCREKFDRLIPERNGRKVILYAPTFRGQDPNRYSPDELDIEKMAERLGDEYILVMKHHQTALDLPEIPEKCRDSFAWDLTRGKGININELMAVSDVLITDYSSLMFEYSLLERPLIFFHFDWDEYTKERGSLYYTREEMKEWGEIAVSTDDIIQIIDDLGRNGFDKTGIKAFKDKYMAACDGHATDRIIDFIYS